MNTKQKNLLVDILHRKPSKRRGNEMAAVEVIEDFWASVGGTKNTKALPETKLKHLKRVANRIALHSGPTTRTLREEFHVLYRPLTAECFVCLGHAEVRHHIVQLQNGGTNFKDNLVSLCRSCHGEIHPWLKV